MKEKIIAAIKAKWPAVNLRKKRIDEIAARLESKITDENDIDAKLDDYNSVFSFADIAKQDDALAEAERKAKLPKPEQKAEPEIEETKPEDDTPVWAKALMQDIQTLKAEKVTNSRKSQYEALFKDVKNEKFKANELSKFDRLSFKDDEDFNAYMESQKEFVNDFNQSQVNESLKGSPSIIGGTQSTEGVSAMMKNYLETEKTK